MTESTSRCLVFVLIFALTPSHAILFAVVANLLYSPRTSQHDENVFSSFLITTQAAGLFVP